MGISRFSIIFTSLVVLSSFFNRSLAGTQCKPQLLKPREFSTPNTIPASPVQTETQTCHLDLSAELFGGVRNACGRNLDRSRCCPVLAAWLFAAHARSALQIPAPAPASSEHPMLPDDSQKCVNSLQKSLQKRDIHIPQPNSTCDAILCFCGIRLHQITSLSCPAAFNVSNYRNATPTAAVKNLERNCLESSYSGCTNCLGALQKVKGKEKNGTGERKDRASKMFRRDCQLMGLTWLLARNKTAYIPTVSAVLRAILYSAYPAHQAKCSPDQENMPLAFDSLQFERLHSSSSSSPASPTLSILSFPILPLFIFYSFLSNL
ncbi:hypothetical protein HHK36_003792 [Tetracentron sinense]|uniref:SPARK domain-containing protein n=1 Tax=Tetracentron sinense TaxID=13715 RepID=A0A834ZPP0_TETSI|nr:hypothetical protein HHK36_003792 [Tetracentron sinense]